MIGILGLPMEIEERRSGNSSRSGNAVHDFSEQKSRYHLGFSLYKTTCASSLRGDIGLLECSYFICVMLIKFSTRDWIFSSPCRAQAFVFVQNPLCLSGISFFEFSTRDKMSFSNSSLFYKNMNELRQVLLLLEFHLSFLFSLTRNSIS